MAGVTLELEHRRVLAALRTTAAALAAPAPLLRDIAGYLLRAKEIRVRTQRAPDATPWQPLSPRYIRREHRSVDKTLPLRAYPRRYETRTAEPYFREVRDGLIGNRFVKKRNSNFAQRVHIGADSVRLPARPWLGVADSDANVILEITRRHLRNAANRRTV